MRDKGGEVGLGQAAQCVDGTGDEGAEFLRVGAAGLMHHPGVDAEMAGAGQVGREGGEGVGEAFEGLVEGGIETAGAREGAERVEIGIEFQGRCVVLRLRPFDQQLGSVKAGIARMIEGDRCDSGVYAL